MAAHNTGSFLSFDLTYRGPYNGHVTLVDAARSTVSVAMVNCVVDHCPTAIWLGALFQGHDQGGRKQVENNSATACSARPILSWECQWYPAVFSPWFSHLDSLEAQVAHHIASGTFHCQIHTYSLTMLESPTGTRTAPFAWVVELIRCTLRNQPFALPSSADVEKLTTTTVQQ